MRCIGYIFVISIFMIFMPNVYAETLEVFAKANNIVVSPSSEVTINVNLKSDEIIAECLFTFENDDNIEYVSINPLNDWTYIDGEKGVLLSNSNLSTNTLSNGLNIFELKYKVNAAGKVVIKTVECVSVNENVYDNNADVSIDFSLKQNDSVIPPREETSPNDGVIVDDNGRLVDIVLSEGDIDFNASVYEYSITVSNFDNLDVSLDIDGILPSYTINKEISDTEKKVVISILDSDGNSTNYIINVLEVEEPDEDKEPVSDTPEEKFNFVPIFIGIICLLVLINIIRIIKKIKK